MLYTCDYNNSVMCDSRLSTVSYSKIGATEVTINANTFQDRIEAMYPPFPPEGDPAIPGTVIGLAMYAQTVAFDTVNITNAAFLHNEAIPAEQVVSNMGELLMAATRICTALGISLEEVMHRKLHRPISSSNLLNRRS